MSRLVSPAELSRDTLVEIVSIVQGRLYLDLDEHGTKFWNPAKEWSCCDVCQDIQDKLHEHGLVPGEEQACEELVSSPSGNNVQSLVEWAELNGVETKDLDELVHDCASAIASGINNGSVDEQIQYLLDHFDAAELRRQLQDTDAAKNA